MVLTKMLMYLMVLLQYISNMLTGSLKGRHGEFVFKAISYQRLKKSLDQKNSAVQFTKMVFNELIVYRG